VVASERRLRPSEWNLLRGAALFALIAVPWHAVVAWREPGLAWFYIVDNQILRFFNLRAFIEDDVPVSTLAFLVLSFLWFFPWSPLVLARPGAARERSTLVIPVWALVVVAFFAVSRSKLEYYALPALPALTILTGAAWSSARDIGRWLVVGAAGAVAVGAAAVWLSAYLTPGQALNGLAELNVYYRILRDQGAPLPFPSVAPFADLLRALGIALCVLPPAAALAWWRGRSRVAFGLTAGLGVVIAALIMQLLSVVEAHHSARGVAAAIAATATDPDVVAHEGPLEYSAALPFYTGRRIVVVNGARGDLEISSRRPEARGYFLDAAELRERWAGPARMFLVSQRGPAQSVVATLPPGAVKVRGPYGSRWLYANH
jgi:hypothetical protein